MTRDIVAGLMNSFRLRLPLSNLLLLHQLKDKVSNYDILYSDLRKLNYYFFSLLRLTLTTSE